MKNTKKKTTRTPPLFKLKLTASGRRQLAKKLGISEREVTRALNRRANPFGRATVAKKGNRIVLVMK